MIIVVGSLSGGLLKADEFSGDRVWLAPSKPVSNQGRWYPAAVKEIVGEIMRFDAQQLAIRVSGDEVDSFFVADRVLWIIRGKASDEERDAIGHFFDKEYQRALQSLLKVLDQRPPIWQQQWLSMLAAQSAMRTGRHEIALELVAQLDRRGLPPLVLAYLPIAWKSEARSELNADKIAEKLASQSPSVRLVSANWLLPTKHRESAIATLKKLTADRLRPLIAQLSAAVLWQTGTPAQVEKYSSKWQEQIELMPMVLQNGPAWTLVERLEVSGDSDQARWLRLSLDKSPVHPNR